MGTQETRNIVIDGEPITVTVEELELQDMTTVPPRATYYGPSPSRLSEKDCTCEVDYDNYIELDHGPHTDTYLYCPRCGCLKNILGS